MEEHDVSYQQEQIAWKTYLFATALNNQKTFSCADLSEIILSQALAVTQKQQPSTGRARYAPFIYRIDFNINITV